LSVALVADSGLVGHVGELSVAQIAEQPIWRLRLAGPSRKVAALREVQVGPAVGVIVEHGDSPAEALPGSHSGHFAIVAVLVRKPDSRRLGEIGEADCAAVPKRRGILAPRIAC